MRGSARHRARRRVARPTADEHRLQIRPAHPAAHGPSPLPSLMVSVRSSYRSLKLYVKAVLNMARTDARGGQCAATCHLPSLQSVDRTDLRGALPLGSHVYNRRTAHTAFHSVCPLRWRKVHGVGVRLSCGRSAACSLHSCSKFHKSTRLLLVSLSTLA